MESNRVFVENLQEKRKLQNRLYDQGLGSKKGLPSVKKANPSGRPSRLGGLQPRNAASSQTRLSTNQNLLTKNKSAMISGASRAIQDVIDRRVIDEEDRLQQQSQRGRATMFQSIEDVQLMTHDPYYEEVDTDVATQARHERHTLEPLNNASSAQAGIFASLQAGANMQSSTMQEDFQPSMPKVKGMLAAKSMATFTPANQLLLKIPKAPTDGTIRPQHPVNNWVQSVGDQLTNFKACQSKSFLPNVSNSVKADTRIQEEEIRAQKQWTTLNCEPYHREQKTNFGVSKTKFALPKTQSLSAFGKAQASVAVSSVTGMKMMTPLGPGSHQYKIRKMKPHQSGTTVGDHQLAYSQSEAFLEGRKETKKLRLKIVQERLSSGNQQQHPQRASMTQLENGTSEPSSLGQRSSVVNRLRRDARESRNPAFSKMTEQGANIPKPIQTGQLETTEEVLRKHYFMAKVTKKTHHNILSKQLSPQKHMIKSQGMQGNEHVGMVHKVRGEQIDQLQTQAASLMRLNAAWGLESKGPQIIRHKAHVTAEEADQGGVFSNVLEGMKQMPLELQSQLTDLDAMIHFYLQQPEDTGFFIYLIPGDSRDPYDLVPLVDYRRESRGKNSEEFLVKYAQNGSSRPKNLHAEKFYTMSKKGFTTYVNDEPIEFISLQDWHNDRHFYRQISSKDFFKNFRKWKIIRMWRRKVVSNRREELTSILEEKLFAIDDVFGDILMKHRQSCKDMENLRVIDVKQNGIEIQTLESFNGKQIKEREAVMQIIKEKSAESRKRFEKGINKTLDNLRQKETEPEEDAAKQDFKAETQQPKQIVNTNPTLEALGFKHSLKYGPRSNLRKACSKFLRFSYLLDFLATEALTNIYLLSVEETIEKLDSLSMIPIENEFKSTKNYYEEPPIKTSTDNMKQGLDKKNTEKSDATTRMIANDYPFFEIDGVFQVRPIPESHKSIEYFDRYEPAPLGNSTKDDFNPLVHLEIDDGMDDEEEEVGYTGGPEEDQHNDSNVLRLEGTVIRDLPKLWLHAEPDGRRFSRDIRKCLHDGMECLKVFERWSRHPDLDKYEAVLEDWDDRVCNEWEPPDQLYLNCDNWLSNNKLYENHGEQIKFLIEGAFDKVNQFFNVYNVFLTEYWQNNNIDFKILENEQLKNPSEVIEALLYRFKTQKSRYEDLLPEHKDIGMIKVNTLEIREALSPKPKKYLEDLKKQLPSIVKSRIQAQQLWLQEQITAISKDPQGVGAYVRQVWCMENIDQNFQRVKDTIQLNSSIFELCVQAEIIGKEESGGKREIQQAYQLQANLSHELSEAREQADKRKEDMKKKINKKVPKLEKMSEELNEELAKPEYLDENQDIEEMLEKIYENDEKCTQLVSKMKHTREYQETLDMKVNQFETVDAAWQGHQIRKQLWTALKEWTAHVAQWKDKQFAEINVTEITELSDQFHIKVNKCESRLPDSTAVAKLSKLVRDFRSTMPIITALGNERLEDYHWDEIKDVLNMHDSEIILEDKEFTLGELIAFEVGDKQEEVVHISTTATQEAILYAELAKQQEIWKEKEFKVVKHKEQANKLTGWEDIFTTLDESLSSISDIQGSRYVKRLQQQVEEEHNSLILISDTVEQWKIFQRTWLYLQNIFNVKDIKEAHQLKSEMSEFIAIEKKYLSKMKKVQGKKIKTYCLQHRNLDEFLFWNTRFEAIQKKVEEYLDEKRTSFPRLYFISNDELLNLLSQNTIRGVEAQLNKLFDQLSKFMRKTEDEHVDIPELIGMISQDGEQVQFLKALKVNVQKGVEVWLKEILFEMMKIVRSAIAAASREWLKDENTNEKEKLENWVKSHCGQAIAVVSMIKFTEQVEEAIDGYADNMFTLTDHNDEVIKNLQHLVELIATDLSSVQRKALTALITHEVHNRDIMQKLTDDAVDSVESFEWKKCLRYYFEQEETKDQAKEVEVRQVNSSLKYGYEYMGVTSRLVITPLTDRCWLTITGALHIKLGASPKGPAGTGKTESTKDLAKGLGIFCLVFNCSEQIEYRVMTRIFSGVVQSGVWTCLDEFNRINVEVMSVIAQQLGDIRQAKQVGPNRNAEGKNMFFLNDKEMHLEPSCGVFITMNPGYQGRAELPDNLKVLFRAVSMMIPAYSLVAEVMLYSEGFEDAKNLATKMVQLYKLSSEQLSQNDHYDFGMRAVKSVLVMAGNLKRSNPDLDEDVVLIRAMRDANVPKFVAEDLPLFSALIKDLFPNSEVPEDQQSELEKQIPVSLKAMNLEVLPSFVTKVTQLFDTFNVRFGVMIVGPAGGGKTTCYKALAHAMTKLRLSNSSDKRYQQVKTKVLNPKSISMDELYGVENADDGAWTDGLASKIIRKMTKEDPSKLQENEKERRHWCVFDGPVDALWIENMNTVLDDNCTLCLANGERVKLRQQEMRMLFEVQDLAAASPATVSRCGMVYMTPSELGWRPYKTQWINKFIKQKGKKVETRDASGNLSTEPAHPIFGAAQIQELENLFEQYVDEALAKLELYQEHQVLQCVNIQLIINLCSFLEYFFKTPQNMKYLNKGSQADWGRAMNAFFCFSFYWAFGGHFKSSAMRFLDNMMREFFVARQIDNLDTVYEYFVEPVHPFRFIHYKTKLSQFEYPSEPTPFFELVVPTVDTQKVKTLLQMMTHVNKPIFVTGATGTGKSMIVQKFLQEARSNEKQLILPIELNFSAQTESKGTQENIEAKLQRKRKKVWGGQSNAKCLIFIDDVNMPQKEFYGAQPPIELLRQLIDMNGFYDRTSFQWKEIEKFTIVCAAAPPSGGRQPLTPRFMRHFQVVNVPEATEETLTLIFESILGGYFIAKKAGDKLKPGIAVQATIDMYLQVQKTMLPIPAKFHYTFNLRDVAKVFQGLLMCEPFKIADEDKYAKLWLHECSRVFADRLCTKEDIEVFKAIACDLLAIKFKVKKSKPEEVFGPGQEIIFSKILTLEAETQYYEMIDKKERLLQCLHEKLNNFNMSASSKMDLVFFDDAVSHIMSIMRILMQPRGNAMLIGVSGSGKQSLTALAAFILEQTSFQVKLSKNFDPLKFREQLKEKMLIAGCEEKPTTFILNDTQIMYESFLEDINNLLNTGDITNLYENADVAKMQDDLEPRLNKRKIPVNKENAKQQYIESLRDQFHIILCMSPVGEKLRVRSRMFPSLINCCTLNWFDSWPQEALLSVANQFLQRVPVHELSNKQKESLSELFPVVHKSVESAANKFHNELRRKTYVTPKSFLDGINLYLKNLKENQENHDKQVKRLVNGIENLRKTTEQIKDLQVELTALRPVLKKNTEDAELQGHEIELKQKIALEQEADSEKQATEVQEEQDTIDRLKMDAEFELGKAEPKLKAAEKAVSSLQKDDITNLKSTKNPNNATVQALKCVLLYLGEKKPDWSKAQKAMTDIKFLDKLKGYDRNNIPKDVLDAVGKTVKDKANFNVETIAKASQAAGGLARWCLALYQFSEQYKVIKPMLNKVEELTLKSNQSKAVLQAKMNEVREIKHGLSQLEKGLQQTRNEIDTLTENKLISERRLENAEKLLDLLSDEGKRWEQSVRDMENDQIYFKGNVFLAAASLCYTGPFTGEYRDALIKEWQNECRQRSLEISPNYSLINTLGNQIEIRDWQLNDLPSDSVSLDNAILVQKSQRWPLMIDPQTQANKWLKKMLRSRELTSGNFSTGFGWSNFIGSDLEVINATTPDDDGKNDEDGMSKKKNNSSQKRLEYAISQGKTVLYEDTGETLDPGLDPILSKAIYEQDGITKINFGSKAEGLEYDKDFRFLLTTKLPNPHFLPETCIKLTIINFTVTFSGLEEQLLVDVMKSQEPEKEKQKDDLTVQISQGKDELYRKQSQILSDLAQADPDTILDDKELIENLENSKSRSMTIQLDIESNEEVEAVLNKTREDYRPIAERGSILYFSITDMSEINQMYQNSLQYVKQLFNDAIQSEKKVKSSENEEIQKKLLQGLVNVITKDLYEKICIGLFEEHKVVYAFIIATRIQRKLGLISPTMWNFLLRGAGIFDKDEMPAKPESMIAVSQDAWELIYQISKFQYPTTSQTSAIDKEQAKKEDGDTSALPNESGLLDEASKATINENQQRINPLAGLINMILENEDEFESYVADESEQDFFYKIPCDLANKLTPFEKILLVKCLKPEKVLFAVQKYLEIDLGKRYATSPISSVENLFNASAAKLPIIFVLSQGVDPMQQIRDYAASQDRTEKLKIMSLGSGQGIMATKYIREGQVNGDWVFLQNCHLYSSWMQQLEILVAQLIENQEVHADFRLILTSMPVDYFPQSILQSSLKMTTEPPRGIKANLQRSYQNIVTQKTYNEQLINETAVQADGRSENGLDQSGISQNMTPNNLMQSESDLAKKQTAWRNLIFGLCFFHAVIQERRKFGPLGWNIVYEFSDSDLIASKTMLKNFLSESVETDQQDDIPWEALKFMTGEINYGGNVTDDFDRILLLVILKIFQNEYIVYNENHKLSKSGTYYVPQHETIEQIRDYIDNQMPEQDEPEIFGMHSNANIAYLRNESQKLLNTVLNVQPRESTGVSGESPEKIILDLIERLQGQVPGVISKDMFAKEIMKVNPTTNLLHCLSTCLLQEVHRYNKLLAEITSSLQQLHDAILGKINMSAVLDAMHTDLLKNRVPDNWSKVSYPSLKPLASWMADLTARVSFMRHWALNGHPPCFWLAGFFFPHGFITGVLQTYARHYKSPIDQLSFAFEVKKDVDQQSITKGPTDGVYIYGLFIENARWNAKDKRLEEPAPGEMYSNIPVIHFKPISRQKLGGKDKNGKDQIGDDDQSDIYKCPVYKTSARAGVLSTTGQSTNFILTVDLPCGQPPETAEQKIAREYQEKENDMEMEEQEAGVIEYKSADFWTLRGAAMLTMLNQ